MVFIRKSNLYIVVTFSQANIYYIHGPLMFRVRAGGKDDHRESSQQTGRRIHKYSLNTVRFTTL